MSASTSKDVSFYSTKAVEFVELHEQVETSLNLLDNLESFLSTFQTDLTAVAGQISELQRRSKDLDDRLKGRRKIEHPLASLISDLTVPPQLATLLLDSNVGGPWIDAIAELEKKIEAIKARGRVKASKDLSDVAEALSIVAATKIRAFFLALLQPVRTNMSTNMQVLQTSVLLKYRPLYSFLQRKHPKVAEELQRAYSGAARTYYETGFRRYIRSLSTVKGRSGEPFELIGSTSETSKPTLDPQRLECGGLDGPAVTMAFMADEKSYKEPIDKLFRSLMIVLMDNATAEYAFIRQFFTKGDQNSNLTFTETSTIPSTPDTSGSMANLEQEGGSIGLRTGGLESSLGQQPREALTPISAPAVKSPFFRIATEEDKTIDGIWKDVVDPILQYADTFIKSIVNPSIIEPKPNVIPILTMIRLNEAAYQEVARRGCFPMEMFLIGVRMTIWPVFQSEMDAHVESLKKLADSATGTMLTRGNVRDSLVKIAAQRYAVLFASVLALIGDDDEPMLFINLGRLRQDLTRLITVQAAKVRDGTQRAVYLSAIYDSILQTLSTAPRPNIHPKAQTEIAFWREREEEAGRRILSSQR